MFRAMAPIAPRIRLVALLALALAAPAASATIYKCLLDDGSVFYQDAPCPPGRELRDFDKDPATVSVVPFQQPPSSAGQGSNASGGKGNGKARNGSANAKANGKAVPKAESKPAKKSAERGDPTQRKFLRPGMSEGEVVARVGPPDMTSSGTRKGARWTYMPVAEDPNTITNLQFDNGRVVEVERKVLR
jgi:hypothetical protein